MFKNVELNVDVGTVGMRYLTQGGPALPDAGNLPNSIFILLKYVIMYNGLRYIITIGRYIILPFTHRVNRN